MRAVCLFKVDICKLPFCLRRCYEKYDLFKHVEHSNSGTLLPLKLLSPFKMLSFKIKVTVTVIQFSSNIQNHILIVPKCTHSQDIQIFQVESVSLDQHGWKRQLDHSLLLYTVFLFTINFLVIRQPIYVRTQFPSLALTALLLNPLCLPVITDISSLAH